MLPVATRWHENAPPAHANLLCRLTLHVTIACLRSGGCPHLQVAPVLQALKPTLFIGVPRVFDKLYEGVYQKLSLERITRRWIFALALWYKKRQLRAGIKWDQARRSVCLLYSAGALLWQALRRKKSGLQA